MKTSYMVECLKRKLLASPWFCNEYKMLGAVNVIMDISWGFPRILLMKRIKDPRDPWSGDICFPGGRVEEGETIQDTIYRETLEEAYLSPKDYEIIGYLPSTNSRTNPHVCVVPAISIKKSYILPLPGPEATGFFYLPLRSNALKETSMYHPRSRIVVNGYNVNIQDIVWGLTYRILKLLISLIEACI